MIRQPLSDGEPVAVTLTGYATARLPEDEPERVIVHANGMVVDVIANDDGSVYVECYAHESDRQAVVDTANIDAYRFRHPNLRLSLTRKAADR